MKIVSKKIFQTMNSTGEKRTIVDITNKSDDRAIKTKAVSMKGHPNDFLVVQQKIQKDGIGYQKLYQMKDKDIKSLFASAELIGNKNLTNLGAKEIKIKGIKENHNENENNTKIKLMEHEISKMSDKLKEMKKAKEMKEKEKKIKKTKSKEKKRISVKSSKSSKKSDSKKIIKKKSSKKMKGGDNTIIAFDPEDRNYGKFIPVEQDKSLLINKMKGGNRDLPDMEIQKSMNDALKLAVDTKTPGINKNDFIQQKVGAGKK